MIVSNLKNPHRSTRKGLIGCYWVPARPLPLLRRLVAAVTVSVKGLQIPSRAFLPLWYSCFVIIFLYWENKRTNVWIYSCFVCPFPKRRFWMRILPNETTIWISKNVPWAKCMDLSEFLQTFIWSVTHMRLHSPLSLLTELTAVLLPTKAYGKCFSWQLSSLYLGYGHKCLKTATRI